MLKFTDGFDHYAPTSAIAADITSYLQAAGYTVNNATNTTFQIVNGTDAGSLGLKLTVIAGSGTPPSLARTFTSVGTKIIFGFGFRGTTNRMRVCRIDNAIDVDWDTATGKLKIGAVIGQDVIILNAWWYLELVMDRTAGTIEVWANNTLQLTATLPGGLTDTHTITWGLSASSPSAASLELDDFYLVDNDGGQNVARLGPVAIITRAPTVDVEEEWTIVGAAHTNSYQVAAQLSPGAAGAPYLQANVAGKTDTFSSNNVLPNANTIFGVALVSYARKGDLDDRQLGMLMDVNAIEVEQQVALTEAFKFQQSMFEQAPGGVPWTQARVEGSKFGIVAR